MRRWTAAAAVIVPLALAAPVSAQDCTSILSLLQQGRSTADISRRSGLSPAEVLQCRRELSQPIFVGPEGPPPVHAAGPPPRNAAGPPPIGAAGPPPIGAAGPPPVGRQVVPLR